MKKTFLALAIVLSGTTFAQELPMPSPTATLQQRIGLTDFTIVYSRPGAKDRQVFGDLVPYNEMWRTGANGNTTIQFNTDVEFAGTTVSPGKYSLFTIPGEGEWTIVLNKKTDLWGTGGYDETMDVARFNVKADKNGMTETFTIDFTDIRTESANLTLSWEKTQVNIPVKVEVSKIAIENIEEALSSAEADAKWRVYRNAANYYHNNNIEADKALEYIDMSIKSKNDSWYSYWLKAEIQADMNNYKEAIASAQKAKEIGQKEAKASGSEFSYAAMIDKGIAEWKAKKS